MSSTDGNDLLLLPSSGIDKRVYEGTKGLTVLSYMEASVLQGRAFEITHKITSGTYLALVTGNAPVLVTSRTITTDGGVLTYTAYHGSFTGGNSVPVVNMNAVDAVVGEVSIYSGVTPVLGSFVTSDWIPGVDGVGQRSSGNYSIEGHYRRLEPNSTYILEFSSPTSIGVQYNLTWREGVLPNDL